MTAIGAALDRQLVRQLGYVVWLQVSRKTIIERTRRNHDRPLLETDDVTDTGIRFVYLYDMLDDSFLPHSGNRVSLTVNRPLETLGADLGYTRLQAEWRGALSTGQHHFLGSVRAGTSFDDPMPYWDRFALGGFLNLSGYNTDQFRGNQLAYGNLV